MSKESTEDRKARIAEIATDIFIEKGYKSTSLQDIAQVAGITKAGIYHYFKTKEDILYHILSTYDINNIISFQKVRVEIQNPDLDPTSALKMIIRAYARLATNKRNIALLGLKERDQLTGEKRESYRKIQQGIFSRLKKDIAGIRNLKKSLDLNSIVFMIISMSAWFGYWLKEEGNLVLEEAIEQSIEIICHGVLE
ncbi:TetR/AcrR family transcriptional regulator [bacterium]|nr:TetR/AcrR family transcriptional regulator [bacterium]